MKTNSILKLRLVLCIVLFGIISIFYIFFPQIGLFFRNDGPEYAMYFVPYITWSILASLPLLYSVFLLWKIVDKLKMNIFFDYDIYKKFYTISRIILIDVIVCVGIFGYTLSFVHTDPGIFVICVLLSVLGILVSAFFNLMGTWVLKGYEIKIEMDLTI